ncbi:MAG: secondary thiamine-phosphate synthase enzyme YjbQ [Euryarchaeota archaeon]|nr:secondary thiamine-phosphate synthase enzyme YjbQ [Euryarchaeota archaeon]
MTVAVSTHYLSFSTGGNADIIDITDDVSDAISNSGLSDGTATIFAPGATGAVTTIECESGLISDLKDMLERIAPQNIEYAHNLKWGDGNGHSHVRAALLGPSLSVPFSGGRMQLGTWQQIIFIDLDNRPRDRKLVVQIVGD